MILKVKEKVVGEVQINRIKTTNYNVGKTRIQKKDYCDTLCARDWKDPKCVQVGNLKGGNRQPKIETIGNSMPSNHDASRIVDSKGLAPTVKENHGTVTATNVSYIEKKYDEFVQEKGYIPEMFNPYNKTEIKDIAPSQTTQCGSVTSSATVLRNERIRIRKLTPKECWRLMRI